MWQAGELGFEPRLHDSESGGRKRLKSSKLGKNPYEIGCSAILAFLHIACNYDLFSGIILHFPALQS